MLFYSWTRKKFNLFKASYAIKSVSLKSWCTDNFPLHYIDTESNMQLVQKYHQAMVYFQISRLRNELGVVSIRICPLQISKQMFTHVGPIWTCYLLVIRWQSSLKLKQCIPKKYIFMLLLFTSNDSFWSAVESVQTTQVTCLSE